jgi:hypothetical protein
MPWAQYFLRTPDADVGKLLRLFTFLPLKKIEALLTEHEVRLPCRLTGPALILREGQTSSAGRSEIARE